jgi:hypothetical protein
VAVKREKLNAEEEMGGDNSVRSTGDQVRIMARITQGAAAWLLGMTPRNLRDLSAPRQNDGFYSAKALHTWDLERQMSRQAGEVDLMMSGGSSPALEEYRRQKVREIKRKNDVEEGRLVAVAEEIQFFGQVGVEFRQELEAVMRLVDPQTGRMIESAIERVAKRIMERLTSQKGVEDAGAQAADGAGDSDRAGYPGQSGEDRGRSGSARHSGAAGGGDSAGRIVGKARKRTKRKRK